MSSRWTFLRQFPSYRSAQHRMPEAGHHDTRCDQRRVFRYPACATPWLTVVADRESATRGRSMLKMQPWSGRLRA